MMDAAMVARATVVLAAAWLVARFTPRAAAAMRHLVFSAAFAILLVLPVTTMLVSALDLEVPVTVTQLAFTKTPGAPRPSRFDDDVAKIVPQDGQPRRTSPRPPIPISDVLAGAWLLGSVVSLLPIVVGSVQVRRLRQRAFSYPRGQQLLETLAADRNRGRRVCVLVSDDVTGPLTCGAFKPAVVLPGDVAGWDDSTLRRALIHELEHVRRWDWMTNTVTRVLCAVYWFNPLVWISWRQLTLEAERACDDAVIRDDDPSAYASLLVSVAERGGHGRRLLAMANCGNLAKRVNAILDRTQQRGRMSRWSAVAALFVAGALTIGVSSMRVKAAQQATAAGSNLVVTVLDPLGAPAADVPLLLENGPFQTPFVAQGYTDRDGRYQLRVPPGSYLVTAPVEFFPATQIRVPAGEAVERTVRMEIDVTTGTFSVCIDCPDSQSYTPPASIVEEFRSDRAAPLNELVIGAEPEVGWELYQPRAPEALRRLGTRAPAGMVVVEGRIATDGRVRDLRVVSAAHPALASAAVATLEDTRWRPARVRSKPVEVPLRVTFEYVQENR
jgi:beta-lactamase regulating signal transducer with metallopeptidase domain